MPKSTSDRASKNTRKRKPVQSSVPELLWLVATTGIFYETDRHEHIKALFSDYEKQMAEAHHEDRMHAWGAHLAFAFIAASHATGKSPYQAIEMLRSDLDETLRELAAKRSVPYADYLRTWHWYEIREKALERAGERCELCNSTTRLQVHHKSYENIWREELEDVIVLCRRCHAKFHDKLP